MLRGCGVTAEATRWLYQRGIRVMGIDAWGWDAPLDRQAHVALERDEPGIFWAAHQVRPALLADRATDQPRRAATDRLHRRVFSPQDQGCQRRSVSRRRDTRRVTESRDLEDGRAWLLARLDTGVHPLDGLDAEAARATIKQLQGLEPEPWTAAWGELSDRFAACAQDAGAPETRHAALMQAYRAAFMGRYPTPNHPLKQRMYDRARELFRRGGPARGPAASGGDTAVRRPAGGRGSRDLLCDTRLARGAGRRS